MKPISLLLAFILALPAASNATSATDENLVAAATRLDAQSRKTLGISVRSASLLIKAHSPHLIFFLKEALVEDGSWPFLQELETAGYAKVRVVTGVPNGQSPETEQVIIQLTDKGKVLASALMRGA